MQKSPFKQLSFKKIVTNCFAGLTLAIVTVAIIAANLSSNSANAQVSGSGANVPAVTGSGANVPAVTGSGANVPAVTGSGANAPAVTGSGTGTGGTFNTNPNSRTGSSGSGTGGSSGSNVGSRTGGLATLRNPLKVNTVDELLGLAVSAALRIGTFIAVLALMYVGFQFVIARGDETKITAAKTHLWWVVIGIAVLFGATLIVEIIKATLSPFVNTSSLGSKP